MPVSARRSVVLPWSMCPAVPTTTLRAGAASAMARAQPPSASASAAASASSSSGSTDRRSRTTAPCSIRPTTAGEPARSRASSASGAPDATHTARDGSTWPGSEPPPTVASVVDDLRAVPGRLGDRARPARRRPSTRRRDLAPDRDLARGDAGAIERERRGDRGEQHLVRAHRAGERVLAQAGDEVRAADDEPGLRAADELVAAERHEVGAVGEALARASARGPGRTPRCRGARRCRGRRRRARRAGGRPPPARAHRAPPRSPAWLKFDGWTRRTRRARPSASTASKSATRVRFVVPTSTSFAPARRTISGIRTPPPISTSSPRLTATPPRPARPTASATAAALLATTSASSAPVSATRCASASR